MLLPLRDSNLKVLLGARWKNRAGGGVAGGEEEGEGGSDNNDRVDWRDEKTR